MYLNHQIFFAEMSKNRAPGWFYVFAELAPEDQQKENIAKQEYKIGITGAWRKWAKLPVGDELNKFVEENKKLDLGRVKTQQRKAKDHQIYRQCDNVFIDHFRYIYLKNTIFYT